MAQRMEKAATTSEIMARFRPIAPKPMLAPLGATANSVLCRARKRGWQDPVPPPAPKWQRTALSYPPAPVWRAAGTGAAATLTRGRCLPEGLLLPRSDEDLLRLSLARSRASPWVPSSNTRRLFPLKRDLLSELQVPKVIAPRPARPLRTTICIDSSNVAGANSVAAVALSKKTVREVEAELELADALPAVVSGRYNRVHLANDAYKAMVGQPVCPWLDSLPGAGASRRINGEVVLNVQTFSPASRLPNAGGAFPCTARISWELDEAITSLTVPCAVERLTGSSGDYHFIWRFDSTRASIIYCLP
ncbi:uncharacterized protein LOC133914672 [Phragmites australis]|uniref:uncharacterized protein LOC133914672 n=1 Tax=Phragmites australis TaxID=29695 RepID=UPI002D78F2CE|nr:uncharacterized protein LOC133914672 [Phragmites australis]